MQFSLRISTLLAGLIILLSLHAVDSLFVSTRRSESQFFTLPLRSIQQRSDIHPQILLQMHINRSIRRLAKMTGAEPPSDRSLEQRLQRRILSLDPSDIDRRFNRFGVPRNVRDVQLEKRFNRAGLNPRRKEQELEEQVTTAAEPTDPNSLGLSIEGLNVGYLADVQIGTPPRPFSILMDSGSADLWVGAENCRSDDGGDCGNHQFLGQQSSSTFIDNGLTFTVTYGTGKVAGTIVEDNIVIGNLSLSNHTFGVAVLESVDFSSNSTPFDGLMGLARSSLSSQQTLTPIESLAKNGSVPAAIVSYKLSRVEDKINDGEITFGGLDTNRFDSKTLISLSNISPTGFWEANLDSVSVNGVDLIEIINRTTILDTGTTLMVLPSSDAAHIHSHIPGAQPDGQGGFTVPCNTSASVALTYGGQLFTIDPRDLARQAVRVGGNECMSGIASSGGSESSDATWLVGDTFLKNAYFSTDATKNTLSLAKLV